MHSNYLTHTTTKQFHYDTIRKLKYLRSSNTLISASNGSKSSIVIFDLECIRKTYNFQLQKVGVLINKKKTFKNFYSKGCMCFDYSKKLNLLVTGSTDSIVRFWDPYVTAGPTMKLTGHKSMVLDVKIHEHFDYSYSYSSDGVNTLENLIIQVIFLY
jgi:WD40 repeat protein